jgi:hypothetical protein
MVERGHLDLVGRDPWVAHEYAKVRWLYAQLGLADRTEIEFFQGGHSIHGKGTFAFLHKHLKWPDSKQRAPRQQNCRGAVRWHVPCALRSTGIRYPP